MAEDRNASMLFSAAPNAPESQDFFLLMRSQYLDRYKQRSTHASANNNAPQMLVESSSDHIFKSNVEGTHEDEVDEDIEFIYTAG